MKPNILLLFFTFIITILHGQTVNIEGDPYGGNPYPTIDSALTVSNSGDVILITGIHTERLLIGKGITLRGNDPATDIIEAHQNPGSATGRTINVTGVGSDSITIENLTIRHGNANGGNGAGIYLDKITGLATLNNVIIENNTTSKNGGGLSIGSSNTNLNYCTIRNNSATAGTSDAGGIHIVSLNGAGIDPIININNSLIANNTATRNGGGFLINGNNGNGDLYQLNVNFENTTIAFNQGTNRGGTGHIWGVDIVAGSTHPIGDNNVHCTMKHVTAARNTSNATDNFGLYFTNGAATTGPVFNIYNSILVSAGLPGNRAINFGQSATGDVINCMIGGQLNIMNNVTNDVNNVLGQTAGQAGIPDTLSDEGGLVELFALSVGEPSIDFCTGDIPMGVTLPTLDALGTIRDATPDAGSYEYAEGVSNKNLNIQPLELYPNPTSEVIFIKGVENPLAIKIYSLSGNLVKMVEKSDSIDIADLPGGLYVVIAENDSDLFSSKFIKE